MQTDRAAPPSYEFTPMGPPADVCLVLEGTYPYVLGGVSSWVHQLVRELPELTFHLWCVGADEAAQQRTPAYRTPSNVVGSTFVPLARATPAPRAWWRRHRSTGAPRAACAAEQAIAGWAELVPDIVSALIGRSRSAFSAALARRAQLGLPLVAPRMVLAHPLAFEHLWRVYQAEASHEPFQTFFWTWVSSLTPVFELLGGPVPDARLYHSISTGYAGMLAARARHERGRPMLLTEHGIYTKERRIEIARARWIESVDDGRELAPRREPYFKHWWNRMFEGMSQLAYSAASEVLTIHHGNTALQLADGAAEGKLRIVSNGIDVERIVQAAALAPPRDGAAPFTVGFIGRIAPIKDIETLLDALALVRLAVPDVRLRLLGPTDEDGAYVTRCEEHAARLGLGEQALFEGPVDVAAALPALDVLVLTSVSEAQPLVLLEAGAAGLPVVATEVGACREMLLGRTGEDRALGASGLLTPIGSPRATADALLQLARDPALRRQLGAAGRARVTRFYSAGRMLDAYREIYAHHLGQRREDAA